MLRLNFPPYPLRIKSRENKPQVFDVVRKKYVLVTPEEWVRQHCIHFLLEEKKYPSGRTLVERKLIVEGMDKRLDIAVCNPDGSIFLMVECKAPTVKIDQSVFDQIARYNWKARAEFLMVTNGLEHYYCQMDYANQQYAFLTDLPDYPESDGITRGQTER